MRKSEFHPEKPRYEIKHPGGATMDMQQTLKKARKVRDFTGSADGRYIEEINPVTGTKQRVE